MRARRATTRIAAPKRSSPLAARTPRTKKPAANLPAANLPAANVVDEASLVFRTAVATPPGAVGHVPVAERPSPRHLEVLRAALRLMGERGYAGASLRELARRVGVQQPSLYHWFESKEQLAEQVVTHLGPELFAVTVAPTLPTRLVDVPRWAVMGVFAIWSQPLYADFVRFLFDVAAHQPRLRAAVHALYQRGLTEGSRVVLRPFLVSGEIDDEDGRALLRTATNGIGLFLIEERIIYARTEPSPELLAYAESLIRLLEDAVRARKPRSRR